MTLVIGDTSAQYYSYPYDARQGTVGPRTVFGDVSGLDGQPDGATLDDEGGLWCALVGGAQLARFTTAGLDRLYVVSVAGDDPNGPGLDGALLVIDDLGARGRLEPRFRLDRRARDRFTSGIGA